MSASTATEREQANAEDLDNVVRIGQARKVIKVNKTEAIIASRGKSDRMLLRSSTHVFLAKPDRRSAYRWSRSLICEIVAGQTDRFRRNKNAANVDTDTCFTIVFTSGDEQHLIAPSREARKEIVDDLRNFLVHGSSDVTGSPQQIQQQHAGGGSWETLLPYQTRVRAYPDLAATSLGYENEPSMVAAGGSFVQLSQDRETSASHITPRDDDDEWDDGIDSLSPEGAFSSPKKVSFQTTASSTAGASSAEGSSLSGHATTNPVTQASSSSSSASALPLAPDLEVPINPARPSAIPKSAQMLQDQMAQIHHQHQRTDVKVFVDHVQMCQELRQGLMSLVRNVPPDNKVMVALCKNIDRSLNELLIIRNDGLSSTFCIMRDCIMHLEVMVASGLFNSKRVWARVKEQIQALKQVQVGNQSVIKFSDGTTTTLKELLMTQSGDLLVPGQKAIFRLMDDCKALRLEQMELIAQRHEEEYQVRLAQGRLQMLQAAKLSFLDKQVLSDEQVAEDLKDLELILKLQEQVRDIEAVLKAKFVIKTPVKILGFHMYSSERTMPGNDPDMIAQKELKEDLIKKREAARVARRKGAVQAEAAKLQSEKRIIQAEAEEAKQRSKLQETTSRIQVIQDELDRLNTRLVGMGSIFNEDAKTVQSLSTHCLVLKTLLDSSNMRAVPVMQMVFEESWRCIRGLSLWCDGEPITDADIPHLLRQLVELKNAHELVRIILFMQPA